MTGSLPSADSKNRIRSAPPAGRRCRSARRTRSSHSRSGTGSNRRNRTVHPAIPPGGRNRKRCMPSGTGRVPSNDKTGYYMPLHGPEDCGPRPMLSGHNSGDNITFLISPFSDQPPPPSPSPPSEESSIVKMIAFSVKSLMEFFAKLHQMFL